MGLTKKTSWSDLWKKEDWLACWIGFIIIAIGCVAVLTGAFDFSALKFSTWSRWAPGSSGANCWSPS